MQGLFTYIYHILLIIVFVRAIEQCAYAYRTTGEAWIRNGRWMFVFLLVESIGSFAFDIGYINDSPIGNGSVLILIKITIDFVVYAFLNHFISDYLHLPHEDSPYIFLGLMYSAAAMLVLLAGYRPFFSVGQSLLCLGPIFTSYLALKAGRNHSGPSDKAETSDAGSVNTQRMLKTIILFMVLIFIQNFAVFYFNDNGWMDLRCKVSLVDDLFSLYMAYILIRLDTSAGRHAAAVAIADTLKLDKTADEEYPDREKAAKDFCGKYKMTGRETEITGLILMGKTNQQISEELFISIGTVKHHIYNIYTKLDIERRSQLMRAFSEFERNSK